MLAYVKLINRGITRNIARWVFKWAKFGRDHRALEGLFHSLGYVTAKNFAWSVVMSALLLKIGINNKVDAGASNVMYDVCSRMDIIMSKIRRSCRV